MAEPDNAVEGEGIEQDGFHPDTEPDVDYSDEVDADLSGESLADVNVEIPPGMLLGIH